MTRADTSLGERLAMRPHYFREDEDDGSMCVCGVPADTHAVAEPGDSQEER